MAEELIISKSKDKKKRYESLIPQIKALIDNEKNLIANLANTSAALKEAMNFFWVGFYLVEGDELILGPFQGPVACTRIQKGMGVCGTSWKNKAPIIVPDVDQFPGHISCSSLSKSEIVIPGIKDGEMILLLDVDSDKRSDFDLVDQKYLEDIVEQIISKP